MKRFLYGFVTAAVAACGEQKGPDPSADLDVADVTTDVVEDDAADVAVPDDIDAGDTSDVMPEEITVLVLLDDVPAPDAVVVQGGTTEHLRTGPDGRVTLRPNYGVEGEYRVMASHESARIRSAEIRSFTTELVIELKSYDPVDNELYRFQDPGEPGRRDTTAQCGHCHISINDQWFESPHRTSARNPLVHDLYAGAAHQLETETDCEAAGGEWTTMRLPGGERGGRCIVAPGVLQRLNADCNTPDCESPTFDNGRCADCHAPAINGTLGGRDLLEATEIAYEYGVSCDVCHRVESVVPGAEPGIAGWLQLHRPGEAASISLGAGGFLPLTFGPNHDVPNPRMGVVQRDHFSEASFCAGCHQDHSAPRVVGATIDRTRWVDGVIPLQSTWAEWESGPLSPAAPCQSCHMPPDPTVANSGNLELFPLAEIGVQGGWIRQAGTVAGHQFFGPRQPEARMVELALMLFVETTIREGALEVTATVRNAGAGHAVPTGEAMRNVLLLVDATCDDVALAATGGDVVPDFGGYLEVRDRSESWELWPAARVGDRLRVIARSGEFRDYEGFGPFGDGTFSAQAKGMPVESYVATVTVLAVGEGGALELSAPLPEGDVVYRVGPNERAVGVDALAGAPGFGFARVTVGADGARNVPSFEAIDIASDNRILPQREVSTTHVFEAACEQPVVRARLIYRNTMYSLANNRYWTVAERTVAEVRQ